MKTLVKFILFLVLVAFAVEFTTKGEQGAFGGVLVKMGVVKSGENTTLKDRVEHSMDRAKNSDTKRYEDADNIATTGN
ncbi:MAG: hypothetical protein Q8R92_06850 [Deltaproteobacteria bacterium]|nr:hypothetical protein [Deltaproteobacteria bacterium]